ncbi:hypothetical protein A6S26_23190 [Nostoc sp. ATCC 43529]|nr:hypothetical protein A6S26_23190 [Nostoc sp. ATCC 43529]
MFNSKRCLKYREKFDSTSAHLERASNGVNVTINTGSLEINNGSVIASSTRGKGNSSNIIINARDRILLDGKNGNIFSHIINAVQPNAEGNAGNIQITTGTLKATNGVFISSSSFAKGNAGNISIKAGELFIKNGATISAFSGGEGNAGNIFIDTRDAVVIDGFSGVFSYLSPEGVGKGGDIQITTNSLTLSNGGQLNATSFGKGNGGDIIVNAGDAIGIDGVGSYGSSSGVFTSLEGESEGRGGNINLTTGSLFLTNGGIVSASTFSTGNAGNITIDASDRILIDGVDTTGFSSGVLSTVNREAVGNGGNINLKTGSLFLTNGGIVNASTSSIGNAGDITIDASDRILIDAFD